MWDIVWVSPQGHRSVSVSRHFLLQAPQCPCSVRKRFSRDHCCRGRSKVSRRLTFYHCATQKWCFFRYCVLNILLVLRLFMCCYTTGTKAVYVVLYYWYWGCLCAVILLVLRLFMCCYTTGTEAVYVVLYYWYWGCLCGVILLVLRLFMWCYTTGTTAVYVLLWGTTVGLALCADQVSTSGEEEDWEWCERPWEEGQGRVERSRFKRCSDWDTAGQDTRAAATDWWTQGECFGVCLGPRPRHSRSSRAKPTPIWWSLTLDHDHQH